LEGLEILPMISGKF